MSGLIEGLPDAIALRCLARVPYYLHPKLELVSRSWKAAFRSAELFRARQEVGSSEDLLCVCSYDPNNTWQLYDPLRDLWITLPELPSKRRHLSHFGAASTSQYLFVLGGRSDAIDPLTGDHDDNLSTNEVWSFDPVTRNWLMRAPMLVPRAMFACCVLEGKIIVAGGFTSTSKSTSKTEIYDSEKDLWVPLPDLLQTHDSTCIGVVIGGKVHIMYKGQSTVQIFDTLELKWRVEDYGWLPGPMAAVQDSLYVMCLGLIFKQDGRDRQVVIPAVSQFLHRIGMAMIGFRGELYVIGGVVRPVRLDADLVKLSDVHVLNLRGEKPTWYCVAPMSRCHGTVLGCTELRI
ncbi:F-box/kelch-repeat protein SKIP30-like [Momordica charantia]|uniref:F-box/kelch-repeat protein SKIP30-like n=1 Tax=Momordica charantia TaxID=3673 RepID=A0A6J1D7Q9_MOMCH|nr:F-box/kelch-repeat protein SKIP30-like [Momordica charantia]